MQPLFCKTALNMRLFDAVMRCANIADTNSELEISDCPHVATGNYIRQMISSVSDRGTVAHPGWLQDRRGLIRVNGRNKDSNEAYKPSRSRGPTLIAQ